jgi:hypothetical protein
MSAVAEVSLKIGLVQCPILKNKRYMNVGNICHLKSALGLFDRHNLFVSLSNMNLAICVLPFRYGFLFPHQVSKNN